jgi:alpha-tubulin suppressor-like RCC1 family protein
LTGKGAAYCWGFNGSGRLGNGTNQSSKVPVPVSGSHSFSTIDAGANTRHTCGIAAGNLALCWGQNDLGQLGDGTTTDRNVPVAVAGGLPFLSISAGSSHTCAVRDLPAVNPGWTYCWGVNKYGALGNANFVSSLVPDNVVW